MDPAAENWLRMADYDVGAAESLLAANKTLYVVFSCHQACEKALKAMVANASGTQPPRTHDLVVLSRQTGVPLPERFVPLLTYLNQSFMAVRYPMDIDQAMRSFPEEAVRPLVPETREVIKWSRSSLTSAT